MHFKGFCKYPARQLNSSTSLHNRHYLKQVAIPGVKAMHQHSQHLSPLFPDCKSPKFYLSTHLNPFHRDALCSTGWSLHSHSSPGVVFSSAVSLKINIKITAFPPKNAHRHCGDESLPQPIEGAMNQSVGSAQGWNLRCQELLKVIFSTRESLMFYLTTN